MILKNKFGSESKHIFKENIPKIRTNISYLAKDENINCIAMRNIGFTNSTHFLKDINIDLYFIPSNIV